MSKSCCQFCSRARELVTFFGSFDLAYSCVHCCKHPLYIWSALKWCSVGKYSTVHDCINMAKKDTCFLMYFRCTCTLKRYNIALALKKSTWCTPFWKSSALLIIMIPKVEEIPIVSRADSKTWPGLAWPGLAWSHLPGLTFGP